MNDLLSFMVESSIMKKICGVYKITCQCNGKFYIGSSVNILNRWSGHRSKLRRNIHSNKYLQRAWNKYGERNFSFVILEECLPESVLINEQKFLNLLKPFNKNIGYNLSNLACSGRGKYVEYIVRFPDGSERIIDNLDKFCKEFNLNTGNMCQCAQGNARSCKGFICRLSNQTYEEWNENQKTGFKTGRNPFVKWLIIRPSGEEIWTYNLSEFCRTEKISESMMLSISKRGRRNGSGYYCFKNGIRPPDTLNYRWKIISPDNNTFKIVSLTKFCKEKNLDIYRMKLVSKNLEYDHKGYKCVKLN